MPKQEVATVDTTLKGLRNSNFERAGLYVNQKQENERAYRLQNFQRGPYDWEHPTRWRPPEQFSGQERLVRASGDAATVRTAATSTRLRSYNCTDSGKVRDAEDNDLPVSGSCNKVLTTAF